MRRVTAAPEGAVARICTPKLHSTASHCSSAPVPDVNVEVRFCGGLAGLQGWALIRKVPIKAKPEKRIRETERMTFFLRYRRTRQPHKMAKILEISNN